MQANSFKLTLEDARMISRNVKHFVFQKEGAPLSFTPGQFITIHFEHNDKTLKRSYSLANSPRSTPELEFAAGFIASGPGTELLFNLKLGATLEASGPFGRLILKDQDPHRYILVATSTGITPYRAMLPELKHRLNCNPALQVVLLQGVQKKADLLYHDEFKLFAKAHAGFTYHACLSQEAPSNLEENQHQGYVQHLFPKLSLSKDNDLVYLCGNPSMVDDAFTLLKDAEFTVQQIIREKYISR